MEAYRRRPKMFRAKYPFTNILYYVPKRYGIMGERQSYQRTVIDDFKNGHYDDALCGHFQRIIKSIITHNTDLISWVITFVPPSIGYEVEYDWRYRHLAQYLKDHLPDVPIIYYGVSVSHEDSWQQKCKGGRRTIKPGNLIVDQQSFRGKSVILIDDVITTGCSFRTVGDALMAAGATAIRGVILAKTIHPRRPNAGNKYGILKGKEKTKNSDLQSKPRFTLPFPDVTQNSEQNKEKPFTLPFPEVATPDQLRTYQAMVAQKATTANPTPENSKPNVKPQ